MKKDELFLLCIYKGRSSILNSIYKSYSLFKDDVKYRNWVDSKLSNTNYNSYLQLFYINGSNKRYLQVI